MKQHASYVMLTVNSSQFHIVPSSLATTAVVCKGLLCCTVMSHRYTAVLFKQYKLIFFSLKY